MATGCVWWVMVPRLCPSSTLAGTGTGEFIYFPLEIGNKTVIIQEICIYVITDV